MNVIIQVKNGIVEIIKKPIGVKLTVIYPYAKANEVEEEVFEDDEDIEWQVNSD